MVRQISEGRENKVCLGYEVFWEYKRNIQNKQKKHDEKQKVRDGWREKGRYVSGDCGENGEGEEVGVSMGEGEIGDVRWVGLCVCVKLRSVLSGGRKTSQWRLGSYDSMP